MNGTIKTKTDKGFGFISREGEEKDLFFHSNDLVGVTFDELQIGAAVTFDIVNGEREYKKIVVGSNRKFIGYIEWVAYLLAQKLNLKVFDPQPPFNNYVKIEELKHTPEQAQAYQKQYEEKNEHKSS